MNKNAFTLAETLIVITIIGVLAVIMLKSLKTDNFNEKANTAKIYKAIEVFDEASANIRSAVTPLGEDTDVPCPMGSFIYKIKNADGTYTYNDGTSLPTSNKEAKLMEWYGNFIKFEKTGIDFCTYSSCTGLSSATKNKLKTTSVRFSNDIYVGIEILAEPADCPAFNLPDGTSVTPREKTVGGKPQCWAKLYIDVNGTEQPNIAGKDIFILGLDENGIYH